MKISFASHSHNGQVREHNEDRYCIGIYKDGQVEWDMQGEDEVDLKEGAIFAVADGMGGEKYGEVAAELAIETVKTFFSSHPKLTNPYKDLQKCFQQIYASVKSSIKQNPDQIKMGTTLTVLYLDTEAMAHVLWLGDTRLYFFSENEVPPINTYDLSHLQIKTRDHSPVWEMVEEGHLTPEDARLHENNNIINKSIGGYFKKEKPEYNFFRIKENTRLLVCSDGLNNMLPDEHIQNVLLNNEDVKSGSDQLLVDALNNGGHDNITSILIKVLELSDEEKSAIAPPTSTDSGSHKPGFFGISGLVFFIFSILFIAILYLWLSNTDKEAMHEETEFGIINVDSTIKVDENLDQYRDIQEVEKENTKDQSRIKNNSLESRKYESTGSILDDLDHSNPSDSGDSKASALREEKETLIRDSSDTNSRETDFFEVSKKEEAPSQIDTTNQKGKESESDDKIFNNIKNRGGR